MKKKSKTKKNKQKIIINLEKEFELYKDSGIRKKSRPLDYMCGCRNRPNWSKKNDPKPKGLDVYVS